uniref:U3 small nucleolar RNA-associated protein 6 homolog C-terminal domain-containing protein n=1 Tax=Romanomermis culicivorax TaxID=13658 RepID=A0A915J0C5_ROMCU
LDLCSNIDQKVEALEFCVKLLSKDVEFRNEYLQALIEKNENRETILKTFNECFDTLDEKECLPIWKLALDWSLENYPEKIEEIFEAAFVRDTSISAPMKSYYLEYVCKIKSVKEMRVAFERLSNLKPNSWDFYQTYLRLEDNSPQRDEQKMRMCFEHAIFEFGSCNVDVWCDYVNFEVQKDPVLSSQVYNRALKSLSNSTLVEEFVKRNLSK